MTSTSVPAPSVPAPISLRPARAAVIALVMAGSLTTAFVVGRTTSDPATTYRPNAVQISTHSTPARPTPAHCGIPGTPC